MSADLLPVLLGLGLCTFVAAGLGLAFFLVGYVRRDAAEGQRLWEELARRQGLAFQVRPPRVSGVRSGVPLAVGVLLSGPSGHMSTSTRVRGGTEPPAPEHDWLRVAVRGGLPGMPGPGAALQTGDAAFDARFATHSADPARARAVLTDARRAQLLALPRDVTFSCGSSTCTLLWAGQERDLAVLERALDLVAGTLGA